MDFCIHVFSNIGGQGGTINALQLNSQIWSVTNDAFLICAKMPWHCLSLSKYM